MLILDISRAYWDIAQLRRLKSTLMCQRVSRKVLWWRDILAAEWLFDRKNPHLVRGGGGVKFWLALKDNLLLSFAEETQHATHSRYY